MNKKEITKIIKEFKKWHTETSKKNWGHFPKTDKLAKIVNGVWYWKGHNIYNLHNQSNKH